MINYIDTKKKLRAYMLRLYDAIDLKTSSSLDIQSVESVCLALGPYRNLTTLTASILFLHPHCQVLNHAEKRIYGHQKIDFLDDYNQGKLNRFIQFAIKISGKGERGDRGGSITYSHAFDSNNPEMIDSYQKTEQVLIKKQIKCLFWKESLRTSNLIRERQVDLADIFRQEDRLRFLLPIRNPLDCAVSNLKTGHVAVFQGLNKDSSILRVLEAVLDEIFWFAALKEASPKRFFFFFEHEISRETLVNMAKFLQLDPYEPWLSSAVSTMKIKPGYQHDSQLIDFYRDYIKGKSVNFPELSKKLLIYIE